MPGAQSAEKSIAPAARRRARYFGGRGSFDTRYRVPPRHTGRRGCEAIRRVVSCVLPFSDGVSKPYRNLMAKDSEVDVVTLFWIVWDQKYLVLAISLLGGVVAVVLALTAVPMYRAQVVVTEVHDTGLGAGASLMGQLGGLASIAGLNVNSNGPDAERAAVLESRGLVAAFVKRYNL